MTNPNIPVKKMKDHGFKSAPDGRLIITDDNEKDSDTEERSKKKKASFLQDDSEEDDYGKTLLEFNQNCTNEFLAYLILIIILYISQGMKMTYR